MGLMAQSPLDDRTEEFESHHIAFLSQKIGFTPNQAQKFWPLYNEMKAEQRILKKERTRLRRAMAQAKSNEDDEALRRSMRGYIGLKKKEAEIQAKFHAKLEQVLPINVIFNYYRAEEKWKAELLRRMRQQNRK